MKLEARGKKKKEKQPLEYYLLFTPNLDHLYNESMKWDELFSRGIAV